MPVLTPFTMRKKACRLIEKQPKALVAQSWLKKFAFPSLTPQILIIPAADSHLHAHCSLLPKL